MNTMLHHALPTLNYQPTPVPRELIREILRAGMEVPNLEGTWGPYFTIVSGASKAEALNAIRQGLAREKTQPRLPLHAAFHADEQTALDAMEQAPAVIFVSNVFGRDLSQPMTPDAQASELGMMQCAGICLGNMMLQAEALGLGTYRSASVVHSAWPELCQWLALPSGEPAAALALGFPARTAPMNPSSPEQYTDWRE